MDTQQGNALRRSAIRGWRFLLGDRSWTYESVALAASFMMLQLLLLSLAGAWSLSSAVLGRGAVHVDILPGSSDQRMLDVQVALQDVPGVAAARYVPREQVFLEEQARDASLTEFLERTGIENPFADTFVVTLSGREGYDALRQFVQGGTWDDVIDPVTLADISAQEAAAGQLLGIIETAAAIVAVLVIAAGGSALLLACTLLWNIIRARAGMLTVERLSGAMPAVSIMGLWTTGGIALLGALALGTLIALGVVLALPLFGAFSLVEDLLIGTFLASVVPSAIAILLGEAGVLLVLSWGAARGAMTLRS